MVWVWLGSLLGGADLAEVDGVWSWGVRDLVWGCRSGGGAEGAGHVGAFGGWL